MSTHFESLDETLRRAGAAMGAAEGHGALCGRLAILEAGGEEPWVRELLDGVDTSDVRVCREALSTLYQETRRALDDVDLSFQPLLPGDDIALGLRVEALGQWCYGFSTGLVLAGLTPERLADLVEHAREFVEDLSQIAQVSPEMVAYDESEADYAELLEYVRVGVLLLFEELQPRAPLPGLH